MRPTVFHIPVCPFSQRLEILLALKGCSDAVRFQAIDITQPRPEWLLQKTKGRTSLPILETPEGSIIAESLVILEALEQRFPDPAIAHPDPLRRAIEQQICSLEGAFGAAGYRLLMNQDPQAREGLREDLLLQYRALNDLLLEHAPQGIFLQQAFGWAELVFTPFLMRFWCLDYYAEFELPSEPAYARVQRWREACLAHPAAQQVSREEVIKLYYDYALGAGNGALLPGRRRSSFVLEPHWSERPWPPPGRTAAGASDEELGLCPTGMPPVASGAPPAPAADAPDPPRR
jgi:glutathione S-transferase